MKLEGSCLCDSVKYSVDSDTPYPFMRCYCSICRKTAGSGGYAINLLGWAKTLDITGKQSLGHFNAIVNGKKSPMNRYYCKDCGSPLWGDHPTWPDLMHPFASSIDTKLPEPPETVHIMLDSKEDWVDVPTGENHVHFNQYPDESIEQWHKRHGLFGAIK